MITEHNSIMTEIAKTYDAQSAQQRWLKFWADHDTFHAEVDDREPFSIVIPPPNVTGALHMGHALNNTVQDVLIRWKRMQGFNTLWMPGTDHAGIATQSVVEKRIQAEEGKTRHDLGREELTQRIWQWKDQYETRILGQLRELGSSCDWARTRFTLDDQCARAVRTTFFNMFRDGYIYRGKRLVNWDTQLQTSVSDDETYTEDVNGGFWTFNYPLTDDPTKSIRFSTTRPETMFGDSGICVHPDDERYKHLVGKTVTIPFNQRVIPIIADGILADPNLGTGAVKLTPAHDHNDYECWQRHPDTIDIINVMNPDGTINSVGGNCEGLTLPKAREAMVQMMDELGHFEGKEERKVPLKFSDRSKTVIEPYLSDQWFMSMGDRNDKPGLAQLAIDAVTDNRVSFTPERYAQGYIGWLQEKRDWCISRQLWWGHRIPVWSKSYPRNEYEQKFQKGWRQDPEEENKEREYIKTILNEETSSVIVIVCLNDGAQSLERKWEAAGFIQDPDVLDTWFSSALWPSSTLGWPEKTAELQNYYPTNVLCTSRDIISLWVARMVMMGLYNLNEVPFHNVYIHPALQDGFGIRMSKSKGNGIDPLDIIEMYGADALRFGMLEVATETQDSRMPVVNVCPHCGEKVPVKQEHMYMRTKKLACSNCKKPFRPGGPWPADDPELPTAKQASDRFEIGRNFANKLWNAHRFILMNAEGFEPQPIDYGKLPTEDHWILSRLATTVNAVSVALEKFKFAEYARLTYDFVWSEFCDWYIELAKGRLRNAEDRNPVLSVLIGVLDGIIRLTQPMMPFLAESLWHNLNAIAPKRGLASINAAGGSACIAAWPNYPSDWPNAEVERQFAQMQELIRGVREVRNRYQIDDKTKLELNVKCSQSVATDFVQLAAFIGPMAGLSSSEFGPEVEKGPQSASIIRNDFNAYISLQGLIDVPSEIARLDKQIETKQKQLKGVEAKLNNPSFRDKAPAEIIEQQTTNLAELDAQIQAMEENRRDLQAG